MRTLRVLAATLTLVCFAGLTAPASWAQSDSVTNDPGYVDLSRFTSALDMRPNVEVNIQGALLDMVKNRAQREDDPAGRLMRNLRSIQVRGFPTENVELSDYNDLLDRLADDLVDDGWEQVMRVQEDNENVSLFMRHNDDQVAGLTMMVSDPSDERLLFINIVGTIQPDDLDTLMGGSGIELDEVPTPDNDTEK